MRLTSAIIISIIALLSHAQTLHVDNDLSHWEANICAGLNNDGYQVDFGAIYFPLQYIGIKANIGTAGEIETIEDWGNDDCITHHEYAVRFKFIPAIVLRSPRIINWKSQDAGFYLFAEPGLILSPGASGSHNAKVVNWDFKGGVNLQLDRLIFFIGYGISNYSLYSGRPRNYHGLPERNNYITHSAFIGTAYKF